jgi:hypothetical protein
MMIPLGFDRLTAFFRNISQHRAFDCESERRLLIFSVAAAARAK